MYAELQQVLWDLGIKNAIYNPENHVLAEEMRDVVLQMAPLSLFGPLMAILSPHLEQPMNEVTRTVADLGEAEVIWAWNRVWSTTERRSLIGPLEVTRT